jgi:hypothetical protein
MIAEPACRKSYLSSKPSLRVAAMAEQELADVPRPATGSSASDDSSPSELPPLSSDDFKAYNAMAARMDMFVSIQIGPVYSRDDRSNDNIPAQPFQGHVE